MSGPGRPQLFTVPPGAQNPSIPGSPIENWTPYLETPDPHGQRFRPYSSANMSGLAAPDYGHGRSLSAHTTPLPPRFPVPQLTHASSFTSAVTPALPPRPMPPKSDSGHGEAELQRRESLEYWNDSPVVMTPDSESLSEELSSLTLESDEGLRRFQENLLPESEEEWHKLVPAEAREAFGKREVERQSVIFEIFKAEKGYVKDLQLIREVFMVPLREYGQHGPPVIPPNRLQPFISEVFFNIDEITAHHQRMLSALFQRQREQHPLVNSVSDIIFDAVLSFRDEYEKYIKHYPLAEARHRKELKRNREYQYFMQEATQDPRARKHDLATFLNRPVKRLTSLKLVLEHLFKLTDPENPDQETLPIMLNVLGDFLKSTQPGVEAAGSKAKFWDLSESLVYMKGEIIDMDLYDERRTVNHSGTLARRQRSETDWRGWNDYLVALLDNYLLLTREETRAAGAVKRVVVSRPIPIEYLRLGAFDAPPETRRERPDGGGILRIRSEQRSAFPFTIYHAFSKTTRRYTLYAPTEASRQRWYDALRDAIIVRKVSQEANMLFAPSLINDDFFRVVSARVRPEAGLRFSGRVNCGTSFVMHSKTYLVFGCVFGIYVNQKGTDVYLKVFDTPNTTFMSALRDFNKLLILYQGSLFYTPLDTLARIAAQDSHSLHEAAPILRRITSADDNVVFFKTGKIGSRMVLMFAVKSLLSIYIHALEVVAVDAHATAQRDQRPVHFRTFGDPVSVPKDVHDITPLIRTIAICGEKGISIADPTNLTQTVMVTVPDFRQSSNNLPMSTLKSRCDSSKPLGIARCDGDELLIVYDEMGCFVDKHGVPTRKCGYVRWESKAEAFVHRGRFLLLFSAEFIEIRDVNSARLVQVLEGEDMRLLEPVREPTDVILVAMHGTRNDGYGVSQKLVELLETAEIQQPSAVPPSAAWEEWDMT